MAVKAVRFQIDIAAATEFHMERCCVFLILRQFLSKVRKLVASVGMNVFPLGFQLQVRSNLRAGIECCASGIEIAVLCNVLDNSPTGKGTAASGWRFQTR